MCKKLFFALMVAALFSVSARAANPTNDDGQCKEFIRSFMEGAQNTDVNNETLRFAFACIEGDAIVYNYIMKTIDVDNLDKTIKAALQPTFEAELKNTFADKTLKNLIGIVIDCGYDLVFRYYDNYGRVISSVVLDKKKLNSLGD